MREFEVQEGRTWVADVSRRSGHDFKGRYTFVARPNEPDVSGPSLELSEIRWNSEKTARRTLETMSDVELRRRLRSALGRAASSAWPSEGVG